MRVGLTSWTRWVSAYSCPGDAGVPSAGVDNESASSSIRFSKACLKNVFSVLLILIYLLLMAVAVFLVYQTITDFREKLKHPVMSVSYKEVDRYDAPGRACCARHQRPALGFLSAGTTSLPEPTPSAQAKWSRHLRASARPWSPGAPGVGSGDRLS